MKRSLIAASIVALASLGFAAGCQTGEKTSNNQASMGIVNTKCPMVPAHPVDPKVTVDYKGQKVGFCCKGCLPKWNALTDDQKAAALEKAK